MFPSGSRLAASLVAASLIVSPPAAHAAEEGATDLYLEVIVNAQPTNLVAHFRTEIGGVLATTAGELRALGIAPPSAATPATDWIALRDLAGVTYDYQADTQTVVISLPASALIARRYDASKREDTGATAADKSMGALLNYTLVGTIDPMNDTDLSAGLEARFYRDSLVYSQTGIVATALDGSDAGWRRLDSTLTYDDPARLATARLGDLISGGLSWTRPIRLGGIQLARNFGLRQDLVTLPLPAFSGTAAVPSTIDITANGATIFSGSLARGPFTIANLPVPSGGGTARVVVTDALGRKVETDLPIFASNALLAPHLADYSLEGGVPRLGYGDASDAYVAEPVLSGSLRLGMTPSLTLEAHAEAGRGLFAGGAGAVFPVAGVGVASLAVLASVGDHAGGAVHAELNLAYRRMSLRLRSFHTIGDYADLATVYTRQAEGPAGTAFAGLARASDQISLSLPIAEGASGSLSFTRIEPDFGTNTSVLGAALTRHLRNDASLFVNAFYAFSGDVSSGAYVGLSRTFGNGTSATVSTNGIDLVHSDQPSRGSAAWRLYASGLDQDAAWLASFSQRFAAARLVGSAYGSDGHVGGSVEASGAVVLDEGVFLANRIDGAFAVVDAGAPDVTVYLENRPVGRSNAAGKILVTGLSPHARNKLAINPDELPADAAIADAEATVVPPGKTGVGVKLAPVRTTNATVLSLRDPAGNVLAPGLVGATDGGSEFVVGYGGEVYVTRLVQRNRLTVTLDDGNTCSAEFGFVPARSGTQPVRDVVCQ